MIIYICCTIKKKGDDYMAQINLRVDNDVKRNAERTLNEIGLSMSTAINIFLKTVVRENRIPFELSAGRQNEIYRDIEISEKEIKEGKAKDAKASLKDMRTKYGL